MFAVLTKLHVQIYTLGVNYSVQCDIVRDSGLVEGVYDSQARPIHRVKVLSIQL